WQLYLLARHFLVGEQLKNVGETIQPRTLLVVGAQDVPRSVLGVRGLEHHVAGAGVIEPPLTRRQIHGAKFPLAEWVVDARFKPALLLLITNLKPNLEELDTIFHKIFLNGGTEFEKASVLFRSAEAHHVLDASSVVPAPVKDHDLTLGREMLNVTLYVQL